MVQIYTSSMTAAPPSGILVEKAGIRISVVKPGHRNFVSSNQKLWKKEH
jgi:hypothetical protein